MVKKINDIGVNSVEGEEKLNQQVEITSVANHEIAISLQDEKVDSKEFKEMAKESLEFEENIFKIDSTGWKEVTEADKDDPILGKFVGKEQKIKINTTGDVVEYLEGSAKGEQLFITFAAFLREVCNIKHCTEAVAKENYIPTKVKAKFFNEKTFKGSLSGYWDPSLKEFMYVGNKFTFWIVDGIDGDIPKVRSEWDNYFPDYKDCGFSGLLIKN